MIKQQLRRSEVTLVQSGLQSITKTPPFRVELYPIVN
jgi:hypothetical protein